MTKQALKTITKGMLSERNIKNNGPDESPQAAAPLPGKKPRHFDNTRISDDIWLPIAWEGEKPVIRWKDEWRWEDYV